MSEAAAPRPLTGAPTSAQVGIPPRHIDFKFSRNADRYFFYNNNPLASLLFVVFSGAFPPGERFFMESVRHFRDQITDPVLKAQVSGFMGQEALHSREHGRLNELFRERGQDVDLAERYVRFGLRQLERFSPRLQLACTTMMEHFTAHLAEEWLTNKALTESSDPEMLKLWYWHALEELEHKSVAYDVFELIGGTQKERKQAGRLAGRYLRDARCSGCLGTPADQGRPLVQPRGKPPRLPRTVRAWRAHQQCAAPHAQVLAPQVPPQTAADSSAGRSLAHTPVRAARRSDRRLPQPQGYSLNLPTTSVSVCA